MEDSLVVKEKYSQKWKTALISSLILALVTFLFYLYIESILWSGIFRLIAFISLTLGIFCMLKVMEGAKSFEISIGKDLLKINYLKNDKIVGTDKLQIENIKSISSEPRELKFPLSDHHVSLSDYNNFKVEFHGDEQSDIALFKFGGRVISIDNKSEEQLRHFLSQHNLYS